MLGKNTHEYIALHHYITEKIGLEGLKHTVGLLHTYYTQIKSQEDAAITLYGLIKMMANSKKIKQKDISTLA